MHMASPLTQEPFWRAVVYSTTPEDLVAISEADSGIDCAINLCGLHRLCVREDADFTLEWNPRETLELTRWLEPEGPRGTPRRQAGERKRLFASTALLVGYTDPANAERLFSLVDNLIIAWDGARELEFEQAGSFMRFLDALERHLSDSLQDEVCFISLLRTLVAADPGIGDLDLACASAHRAWCGALVERRASGWQARMVRQAWDWVLDTTVYGQRRERWSAHLDEAVVLAATAGHGELLEELQRLRDGWVIRGDVVT